MDTYKLINPYIIGHFNTNYTVDTGLDAALQFWDNLNPHITNNIPKLYVSFQRLKDNQLSHFKISEKISNKEGKLTNYTITELPLNLSPSINTSFIHDIEKLKNNIESIINIQTGGSRSRYYKKNNDDDSSSSSSDSDSDSDNDYFDFSRFKRTSQPISYWLYNPLLYGNVRLYQPTFNLPMMPYIHLWVPKYLQY